MTQTSARKYAKVFAPEGMRLIMGGFGWPGRYHPGLNAMWQMGETQSSGTCLQLVVMHATHATGHGRALATQVIVTLGLNAMWQLGHGAIRQSRETNRVLN